MTEILKIRTKETRAVIDLLHTPKFLQEEMHFDNRAKMVLEALMVAGHSTGGTTALQTANDDKRVKYGLSHDPWMFPLRDAIKDNKLSGFHSEQAFCSVNNYHFSHKDFFDNHSYF